MKLIADIEAVGVHGVTGQDTEVGTLPAGTLVRDMRAEETIDGTVTTFRASTDGGRSWYRQRTYGRLHAD